MLIREYVWWLSVTLFLLTVRLKQRLPGKSYFFRKMTSCWQITSASPFSCAIPVMLLSSGLTNALSENIWKVPTGSSTLIVLFLFRSLKQPSLTSLCYIMSCRISSAKDIATTIFWADVFCLPFHFFHTQRFHVSAIQMHKLCCA